MTAAKVTTMIDFYGFSAIAPFKDSIRGETSAERVTCLEELFKDDIGDPGFLPYLQLHEFEALVFVSPADAAAALTEKKKEGNLLKIKNECGSPEEIDDNPETASSKRLQKILPSYNKAVHGPIIIKRIGFARIRRECPHFDDWVTRLENL